MNKYVDDYQRVYGFNGTVLVLKNGKALVRKAYGYADREWQTPMTVDSKFSLASVSKIFTAVAILQLIDSGKLHLENRLADFFPTMPKGDSITLHMLLTHTSGLGDDFNSLYVQQGTVDKDSVVRWMNQQSVLFSPGTQVAYSNIGYFLLSLIVEKASGESFPTYMRQRVFAPAGMRNSGINSNDTILPKRTRIYGRWDGKLINDLYINWDINRGHDGVYSTVDDLAKFTAALAEDRLLSPGLKSRMFTSYNRGKLNDGMLDSYGYGVMVDPAFNNGRHLIAHTGGFGGVVTSYNWYPKDNLLVVALSNGGSGSTNLCFGLSALAFGKRVDKLYKPLPTNRIDTARMAHYAGVYEHISIGYKAGKLYYLNRGDELMPESETKFFFDEGERVIEFLEEHNGRVKAIRLTRGGIGQEYRRGSEDK